MIVSATASGAAGAGVGYGAAAVAAERDEAGDTCTPRMRMRRHLRCIQRRVIDSE